MIVYLLIVGESASAVIPMTRVTRIINGRTIATENATVVLLGVQIPPEEEGAATEYLHRLLDGTWVYVEDGNVYRSPDALYVNAEMQRRAWHAATNMRYLGESWPAPVVKRQASARPRVPFAKRASPSRVRRRGRSR